MRSIDETRSREVAFLRAKHDELFGQARRALDEMNRHKAELGAKLVDTDRLEEVVKRLEDQVRVRNCPGLVS